MFVWFRQKTKFCEYSFKLHGFFIVLRKAFRPLKKNRKRKTMNSKEMFSYLTEIVVTGADLFEPLSTIFGIKFPLCISPYHNEEILPFVREFQYPRI